MFADVDEVLCQRAKWNLRILVPGWAASICMLLGLMGVFAYRLADTVDHWEDTGKMGDLPEVEMVWEVTNVAFSLIALVLSTFEITKLSGGTLTPFFLLCSQLIKLTLSLGTFGLDVTAVAARINGVSPAIGLAINCLLTILGIFTLIYATSVFRDVLRFEKHSPAGRSSYAELVGHDVELGAAGPSSSRSGQRRSPSVIDNPGTAYRSQTGGEAEHDTGFEFGWDSGKPGDVLLSRGPRSPGLPSPGLPSPGLPSPGLPSPRGMAHGNGMARDERWRHQQGVPAVVVSGHGDEQEEADATLGLLVDEKD